MKKSETGIHCIECNTYIPNDASMVAHLKGKKHLKNAERVEKWRITAQRCLYVCGIEVCTSAELELADYFSQFGAISKISVDKTAGRYAIVEFADSKSAESALKQEKHLLGSHQITVRPRELKLQSPKKKSHQNRVSHNLCPPEIWKALIEAKDVEDQFSTLQNVIASGTGGADAREHICQLLQSALTGIFPSCEIQPFGSSVNGFGIHSGDLDLNFKYSSVNLDKAKQFVDHTRLNYESFSPGPIAPKEVLSVLSSVLKKHVPECCEVKAILTARRPIVKFHHRPSGMACDISVGNELALRNTYYLQKCCQKDPLLAPCVLAVRLWAKHWNLAGSTRAASPLLNNYAVSLLVLFYFHHCKRLPTLCDERIRDPTIKSCIIENWDCSFSEESAVLGREPQQQISELLSGFFAYYSQLKFSEVVLCLKTGKCENVEEVKSDVSSHPIVAGFKYGPLNIRDPFELNRNVAGNVGSKHMFLVTKCLRNAALSCEMNLYKRKPSGFKVKMDPWGILNLLVDHHKKVNDESRSAKDACNTSWSMQLSKELTTQSDEWHKSTVSLICTVLSDVFLMTITGDIDVVTSEIFDPEDCVVKVSQFPDHLQENSQSPILNDDRKRRRSPTPVYHKRAKLALNSPEVSRLRCKSLYSTRSISLPTTIQCDVTYRLWEGRRKARRHLSQPGLSDMLDLERQVSRLLLSDKNEISLSSSANTSSLSESSIENPTDFRFSLNFAEGDSDTLNLDFHLISGHEGDFQNFSHHIQIFLPQLIKKATT